MMNWKSGIGLLLSAWLLLGACKDSKDEPLPNPNEEETRTVLVYIAGDNSLSSYISADIKEMMSGMEQLKKINGHLLVYVDQKVTGFKPKLLELYKKGETVDEIVIQEFEANRNSVGVEEMKEVLSIAFSSKFKANHYGLVFWSHGEAWAPYQNPSANSRWIGQDLSNGDHRMNVNELVQVLQSAPHLDFLMLDLCLGASIELMYEIKEYVDYIIASPTEIPAPGSPYDKVVMQMFNSTYAGTDYVQPMAQAYFDYYNGLYDESTICTDVHWTGGASIGVIQCSQLAALARATRQVWPAGGVKVESLQLLNYDNRPSYYASFVGYYDMWQLVEAVATDPVALQAWKEAFAAAVPYYQTTPRNYTDVLEATFSMEGSRGVSHYLPTKNANRLLPYYRSLAWYQDAGIQAMNW